MVETRLSERYRLDQRIALGGMGAVFAATDERLGRPVAIKLLKDELAQDPQFIERFRREARAIAALSHPNIAGVFDYGEDNGRHYIVMELVQGRDLARVLREDGRLSPERAVAIGVQVCDALAHAHAAGMVHRDVKPANIIVADDRVKVTDFGIARAAGHSTLTATGSVLGTAQYISPEQAAGKPIGPASDLYSLGIVLYEMLTGSVPFTGDSAIAVAMRHVSDDVPPPSSLNPDVPPGLDHVVARATAKSPNDRFHSASDMGAALRDSLTADSGAPTIAAAGVIGAPTAAMTGGMVPTAPLPGATNATQASPQTVWPIPGNRWDPAKVGRIALITLLLLGLFAAGFLLMRAIATDEPARRGSAAGAIDSPSPAGPANPAVDETTPAGVVVPPVVGSNFSEAEQVLKDMGLEVDKQDVEDSTEPKDIVVESSPVAGTTVPPGATVTLFVSTGPPEDEEPSDPEGEDTGNEGPGGALEDPPGKAKGKDKEDKGKD